VEHDSEQVMMMVAPRWPPGGNMTETAVRSPTQRHVEQALRQLNGSEFHDLYLRTPDITTFLGICGGPARYLVGISDHAERCAQLLNLSDPSEAREDMMCGGEPASIPHRFLVDLPTALTATVYYLATTQAAPALSWEWL
jgi:hypothetical protein